MAPRLRVVPAGEPLQLRRLLHELAIDALVEPGHEHLADDDERSSGRERQEPHVPGEELRT